MKNISKTLKSTSLFLIALLTLALLAACGQTAVTAGTKSQGAGDPKQAEAAKPKEKVVVNIGLQGKVSVLHYAREKKIFEDAFAKVGAEVRWSEFQSGPPYFEAMAAGRLDLGSVGGTPVVTGQAADIEFKAVAVYSDGRSSNAIVLPKTSPIKDFKELKGKKLAIAKGSSSYYFLYKLLDMNGMKDTDLKIIQLQPDEARPALETGAIDAWATSEQHVIAAEVQVGAKKLITGEDIKLDAPGFIITRTKFAQEHPELLELFLKTYEQTRIYYVAHLDELTDYFVGTTKLEKEIVKQILQRSAPLLSPITPEFAKAHQTQADFLYETGGVKKKLDTSKVMDNAYIDKALKNLK
ncbi:aliphatic sulfonate ABC transporter substrate-binding protein [Paenibacillus piri]|uniref:Putative aliphatic sulfonates-binding protein n=1 Tax=Paenibacillus piri TaxID=2547395 RepID=A0A4R5KUP1_9BACL|nr:aliphatic sulfonate ABC transporter substrate-binding protein [Paenibacillus piri]TDF98785.1 aliphatic sulfonate ABC transporter substrate-binding protein [Paenibacillus piri]